MNRKHRTSRVIELDQALFHNELSAALNAGVPLEFGSGTGLRDCKVSVEQLGRFQPLQEDAHSSANPKRYVAAAETYQATHSMIPVLNGLSEKRLAFREVKRVYRWTFIYCLALMAASTAGLYLYQSRALETLNSIDQDLRLYPAVDPALKTNDFTWLIPILLMVFGGLLVGLALWFMVGGISKAAYLLGGKSYVQYRTTSAALEVLGALNNADVPTDQAIQWSADLCDIDSTTHKTLKISVQDHGKTGNSSYESFRSFAQYYDLLANKQLKYMRFIVPTMFISVVGGLMTLMYCLAIYGPFISLLQKLVSVS